MQPKTVFIADADADLRTSLADALSRHDELRLLAHTASGTELIDLARRHNPDLVIMDLILADTDGVEVLSALLALPKKPSVLILSTFTSSRLAEFVSTRGANYFMAKPCQPSRVAERACQMLRPTRKQENLLPAQPLELTVTSILHETGVPAHIAGYQYLRSAILAAIADKSLLSAVTKVLYPSIARQYDTTAARVERSMRHAIELAWSRADLDDLRRYFGSSISLERCKPTITEFVSMIADRLRLEQRRGLLPEYSA